MTRTSEDELERLGHTVDGFGRLVTAQYNRQIDRKVQQGLSRLRDEGFVDGSQTALPNAGRIEENGTDFKVSTTATGTNVSRLETAEFLRYAAGSEAEIGFGVRLPSGISTSTSGQVIRWGGITSGGIGVGFGIDDGGIFVWRDVDGSGIGSMATKVYQSDWNGQTVGDGTDLTYDLSTPVIHHVDFEWYGAGPVEWQLILSPGESGAPRNVFVHREHFDGAGPVLENPNLAPFIEIDNNGTATATETFAYGRQAGVKGALSTDTRITYIRERGVSVGSAAGWVPLIAVRRKSNVTDGPFWESTSIMLDSVEISTDQDIDVALFVDPDYTVSTSGWGALSDRKAGDTALERDTDVGTASLTGSTDLDVFQTDAEGGGGNKQLLQSSDAPDVDFKRRHPHVLAANVPGGTDATVDALLAVQEEW